MSISKPLANIGREFSKVSISFYLYYQCITRLSSPPRPKSWRCSTQLCKKIWSMPYKMCLWTSFSRVLTLPQRLPYCHLYVYQGSQHSFSSRELGCLHFALKAVEKLEKPWDLAELLSEDAALSVLFPRLFPAPLLPSSIFFSLFFPSPFFTLQGKLPANSIWSIVKSYDSKDLSVCTGKPVEIKTSELWPGIWNDHQAISA